MSSSIEQKTKFEEKFNELVQKCSPEIQKKWDGNFIWVDLPTSPHQSSQIKLDHVVKFLPPKLKDEYSTLLRKLKDGRL